MLGLVQVQRYSGADGARQMRVFLWLCDSEFVIVGASSNGFQKEISCLFFRFFIAKFS